MPAGGYSSPLKVAERMFWRQFTDPKKPFASNDSLDRHVKTPFEQVACTDWFRNHPPFLVGCARMTTVAKPSSLPFGVVVASPLFARRARPQHPPELAKPLKPQLNELHDLAIRHVLEFVDNLWPLTHLA